MSLPIAFALIGSALFAQDLSQFTAESRLATDQVQSISRSVLDSVEAGASELRQQISYDPAAKLARITGFEAASGAPLPTAVIPTSATLWAFDVRVDAVSVNNDSVVMTGVFQNGDSPFGDSSPSSAVISFAYSDNNGVASFRGISVSLVGAGSTFASTGVGRIGVQRATVTAVAGPRGATVTGMQFVLDGRRSSTTSTGGLTYEWQFLPAAGQVAQLIGETSSVLTVSLQEGNPFVFGDYTFRLTVRNSAGATASDTVTVSVLNPSGN